MAKQVQASCYNQVRLALHRLENSLRVPLPGHPGLEILLEEEAWLCLDIVQGGMPGLRWHSFEVQDRRSLHEPINCRLDLYHIHAGLVMGTVLETLEAQLKQRLAQTGSL
jgi:hypothetical protein